MSLSTFKQAANHSLQRTAPPACAAFVPSPSSGREIASGRESPGRGYRHVLTKRDLQAFLVLVPDWPSLSHRLERIVLAAEFGPNRK
jgi:hypothetical protein